MAASFSPRRLLSALALTLVIAGIGISTYLTITHYTEGASLACPNTGTINCAKVTSSSYATLFSLPVALWGLLYFLALLPLYLPFAWRLADSRVSWLRLGLIAIGIPIVFWLVYAELFKINAICLWCTAIHGIVLVLFGITAFRTALSSESEGK